MERTDVICSIAALALNLHDELQRMAKDYDLGRLPSAHKRVATSVELLDAIAGNLHRLIEMARDDGLETGNVDFARMRARLKQLVDERRVDD